MQQAMRALAAVRLPDGDSIALALKVAVTSGPARRFVVGDPAVQFVETLAGATVARLQIAEHLAHPGEVIVDLATVAALGDSLPIAEWRVDGPTAERFAILQESRTELEELKNAPAENIDLLSQFSMLNFQFEKTRAWLLPPIYERLRAGLGEFLTELRPAVALFLRFSGIDYDADDAGERLDSYIRWVQGVLAAYDGLLLQLTIGDKGSYFYAAFGAPSAHEDDARRAALAALELRAPPPSLAFVESTQIGISQGTLRAGAYGGATRRTYGVLGDDVNLAARLMQRALPGEVLVSDRVRQALAGERALRRDGLFVLEALPLARLKGLPDPVPVFRLAGARDWAFRLAEPAHALPLVGRAAELALVAEKLDLALQGRGQVVGITGEAGLGKSRLVGEAIHLARRKGLRIFGGACQSYGTNSSYLVWGPIWRGLFGLDSEAPPRRQQKLVEAAVAQLAPERWQALPLLGPLLGLALEENDFTRALEPQHRQSALHALLLDCLRAAARAAAEEDAGLLLVLEDLHWIDPASHELLELVARALVDAPLLIMLAYRPPELLRLQTPRVEALEHFTHIELAALSADESEQIIQAKLAQLLPARRGAAPPALVAQVTARAQGNPFYIEELLHYLHDRGIDPLDEAATAALDLPASLHTLILSRIDQLSEHQRATLKLASVVGRLFRFAWLHGAYPALGKAEPLRADLAELARLELTPLDTPEPELIYLFKHIITQEVAYSSLAAQARARLHEQLAQYLERLDAEKYLDLLAYHYGQSANLLKKRVYLRRAGEAAAARYANTEALDYLGRALDLAPEADSAERYALLLAIEKVHDLQGAREAQARDLEALEQLAEALADDVRRAEVAARRASYAYRVGDSSGSIAAAARAVALAPAAGASQLAVGASRQWAWALLLQGDYAAAQRQAEASLDLARATGDRRGEGLALGTQGAIAWYQGDYAAARSAYEQSLSICREIGNRQGEGLVLGNLGLAASAQGDYAAARSAYEQSLSICREIGDRLGEGWGLGVLGDAALSQGDYAAARSAYEQSLHIRHAVGDRQGEGWALGSLGLIAHSLGDDEAASGYARKALTIAQAIGDRDWEAFVLTVIGHAELGMGRRSAAAEAYQAALSRRRELGQPNKAAEPLAGLARIALAAGELGAALAYVADILAHLAEGTLEGADEPLRVYLTCYEALRAARDARAADILDAAHTLLRERAARIPDAATRRSFLEQVPYHRQLIALWTAEIGKTHGGCDEPVER
jgi:predicted ATPase/class 3 adenylate cyclase